jgi:hypothetical protein
LGSCAGSEDLIVKTDFKTSPPRVRVHVENVGLESEQSVCCFCCDISFGETFTILRKTVRRGGQAVLGSVG